MKHFKLPIKTHHGPLFSEPNQYIKQYNGTGLTNIFIINWKKK